MLDLGTRIIGPIHFHGLGRRNQEALASDQKLKWSEIASSSFFSCSGQRQTESRSGIPGKSLFAEPFHTCPEQKRTIKHKLLINPTKETQKVSFLTCRMMLVPLGPSSVHLQSAKGWYLPGYPGDSMMSPEDSRWKWQRSGQFSC